MRSCGHIATYHAGCRCGLCRQAAADARRASRARLQRLRRRSVGPVDAPPPGTWVTAAACASVPMTVFFPEHGGPRVYDAAKQICFGCGVRLDCLDYAVSTGQRDGCWGGLSPDELHLRITRMTG